MTRRSKATLLAIAGLVSLLALRLWPGAFLVNCWYSAVFVWLSVLTTACVLSFAAGGARLDGPAVGEMLIWCVVGGASAWLLGVRFVQADDPAALAVVASIMVVALLYGARHARSYYPVALIGQVAGFVCGIQCTPILESARITELPLQLRLCLNYPVFGSTLATVGVILASVAAANAFRSPKTQLPRPILPKGLSSKCAVVFHRTVSVAIVVVIIGWWAPDYRVTLTEESLRWHVTNLRPNSESRPSWPALVLDHRRLVIPPEIQASHVDEAGIRLISLVTKSGGLYLSGAGVTDRAMVHLRNLSTLEYLTLHAAYLSETGLEHISHLSQLRSLDLSGVEISDKGFLHLSHLKYLHTIRLRRCVIDRGGLPALLSLPRLRLVSLPEGCLGPEDIAGLRQDHPNVTIVCE